MKELRLKIKRENYNLFKELGDKQAICTTANLSSPKTLT